MVNRFLCNYTILCILDEIVSACPELRFTQILSNLGLDKDNFYEEPDKTLERICNSSFYKEIKEGVSNI